MIEIRHQYCGFDLNDHDQDCLMKMIEEAGQYPEVGWIYELDNITIEATRVFFGMGLNGTYCLINFRGI